MKRNYNTLNILHILLRDSDFTTMPRAKVAAALVYKNKIISIGLNHKKSCPFQKKHSLNDDSIYLHAENLAIKRALKILTSQEMFKSNLFVCRIKFDHDLNVLRGLARPCKGCQKAIQKYGIQKVIYSLNGVMDYGVMKI